MTNILDEIKTFLHNHNKTLKAAALHLKIGYDSEFNDKFLHATLPEGFTYQQWQEWERQVDIEYDDGYGTQKLFGRLWFVEGGHAERAVYDGAEWWVDVTVPPPPKQGEIITDVPNGIGGG